MLDRERAREVLAALRRRQQSDGLARLATDLRARFEKHPKQRAFWQSQSECRRDAALTTRRAGKSDGGVHEWLATAITTPGWRGVYVNETMPEGRKIVWRNDMGQGFCDLIAQHGESLGGGSYKLATVIAKPNETTAEINFSNGSQIALFGADDEGSINKLRGQAKDAIWCDEAQKFKHLRAFVLQVASACLKDKEGRLKLTGTPSEDAAGYFYDVTCEPDSGDTPLPKWDVHRWSVTDNPWFGATAEERWARTAGEALAENGWDGTEPEFMREWLGRWVKGDARYVYPVHAAPGHIRLCYAPQRLRDNPINGEHPPWIDVTVALRDLPPPPPRHKPFTWLYAIGADFGYAQDPFALCVWAMTPDLPEIYELFSWKMHKVVPDDQRDYLKSLWDSLDNVIVLVGDPAGQVAANMAGWRERMGLPIDEAEKSSKVTWQTMMAGDIRKGRVRYREGSPLLTEHKHLVYLPTKPGKPLKDHADRRSSDGKVHGNHCLVAGTMVETAYGPRPIELVVPGDRVWTRRGLRTVTSSGPTRVAPTFELLLDNGYRVQGTGDHPIATPEGWIELRDLTPDTTVFTWASMVELRRSPSVGSAIAGTQSPTTAHHASTSRGPSSEVGALSQSTCIEPSGSQRTAQFPTATTSTTATRIPATTPSRTSSAYPEASTCASMARHLIAQQNHGPIWAPPGLRPPCGTAPKLGARGTPSMPVVSWPDANFCSTSASNATPPSAPRIRTPSSAVTSAELLSGGTAELTTSTDDASSAAPCSASTGTAASCVARARVVDVRPSGRVEQTYDLSVEDAHEFVANGIVVSNCSDAGLYAFRHLTHYLSSGAVSRPEPGTPEAYAAESERLERKMDRLDEIERDREARYERMESDDESAAYHAATGDYTWQ